MARNTTAVLKFPCVCWTLSNIIPLMPTLLFWKDLKTLPSYFFIPVIVLTISSKEALNLCLQRKGHCTENLCYSRIFSDKQYFILLRLVLLCTKELQLCEGEMWRVRPMNLTSHAHTHTQKKNPLMGEMRGGVGRVTAWLKDGERLQWMSTQGTKPHSSTSSLFFVHSLSLPILHSSLFSFQYF